jgi:antitoxin (DNA-binding transcriptional repressor) of toxin-antitoxin stability system
VVIARDNKPVARLVPLAGHGQTRVPGSAKGQILKIAADFDAPLADFKDYE